MHRMLSSPLILIPLQAGTIQVETREVQASNTRDLPFPVAPMRFIGFIGNIDNVNMTGTIQEVVDPEYQPTAASANTTTVNAQVVQPDTILPIECCNWPNLYFGTCNNQTTLANIRYLTAHGGGCYADAGTCVRASCSYNAAVYLCNQNTVWPLELSCLHIADCAIDIVDVCGDPKGNTCGQEFDAQQFGVVVKGDI